jgi:phosphoribosylformimino-5-aminoimidazole carboxamide ribotide isomerase
MILFPAIDLKGGQCVRLFKGDLQQVTVYNDDPAAQARIFSRQGFEWLHVVDLDGAVSGLPVNRKAVEAILAAVSIPVQLGGGIRNMQMIDSWLSVGVARVILGTVAVKNPALVYEACQKYPGRIVIGIDARDGMVATEGWGETSDLPAVDLALKLEDAGAAAIIFTDIARDGTKAGVNLSATVQLARAVKIPVIASGGVHMLEDLRMLLPHSADGIAGVISGRALYDGTLDPRAALAVLSGKMDYSI